MNSVLGKVVIERRDDGGDTICQSESMEEARMLSTRFFADRFVLPLREDENFPTRLLE